jgi:hypothetical protein
MRTWRNATMTVAHPKPPVGRGAMPARILVTEEGLAVKLPECDCLPPTATAEMERVRRIQASEIWRLLDEKRVAEDWNILLARSGRGCTGPVSGPANHVFFVFEDAVVAAQETGAVRSRFMTQVQDEECQLTAY